MSELLLYSSNKNTGKALCRLLNKHNFVPVLLKTTEDLLEKIRFGQADVVVLDITSISLLCSELYDFFEMAEDIPIIILTPYDIFAQEIKHIRKKEHCYFIVKPISTDKLANLLNELLP